MYILTPKGFLQVGGAVLLLVGILGFVGVIGPTPAQSIFGSFWWFDTPENVAHAVLGIAGLLASFVFPAVWQRYLVILLGIVAVLVGLYNFASPTLLGAHLESPADLVLHLVIGAWALYAAFGGKGKKA